MLTAAAGSASPLPPPSVRPSLGPRVARSLARRTLRLRQSARLSSARRGAGPGPAAGAGSLVPATGRGPGHDGRDGQQGGDGGKDCQQRAEEAHPRAGEGERIGDPAVSWARTPAPIPPWGPVLSSLDDRCRGPSEILGLRAWSSERPLGSASSVSPPPSPHRGGAEEGAAVLPLPPGLLCIFAAPLQRRSPRFPQVLEVQANCVLEAEGQEDWDELAPLAVQVPAGPVGRRHVRRGLPLVPGATLLWESRRCFSARAPARLLQVSGRCRRQPCPPLASLHFPAGRERTGFPFPKGASSLEAPGSRASHPSGASRFRWRGKGGGPGFGEGLQAAGAWRAPRKT